MNTNTASNPVSSATSPIIADWRDFYALTKPGVMKLVVFTGLAGMLAAPTQLHPILAFSAILAIALAHGAAATLNQWYEADIDAVMQRTSDRPLPAGRMDRETALHFGVGLGVFSVILMGMAANWLAAATLAAAILFYVCIYTIWLKRRTPQNIVIGGAAGAFPPLIGWAAATGEITMMPILLFALIFLWTPPHFWALSLYVNADYARAGVPMMTVVAGTRSTRRQMLVYTLPMAAVAIAPWPLGLAGAIYGLTATGLSAIFLLLAISVWRNPSTKTAHMVPEKRLFLFSILYLFALFGALVVDAWVPAILAMGAAA
ncbi:protoheme IX farnesyltransferase [Parasphingopyxis sp. CP4]|uniref:heme o synthase n=1 Tax=Parasphingopyxis sp. CP4 TaxID=2724527 RepID=UPI0015A05329|nr:heme o synthase [Parasphingopyxis sp. CP4]QLC22313.1 protoheme IX farnesyltransferase [Parasphingopyxis sp. CP4]